MGEGLNAGPYILAAYSTAALFIIAYSLTQWLQRTKLRQLESAAREGVLR